MLARVRSAAVLGIDAYLVDVETDIANGLPTFATVGLPQGAVKEGRGRVYANAHMAARDIRTFCRVSDGADALLRTAIKPLALSARAYHRILKIARTIADLAGVASLDSRHVSEAIQYRSLDRRGLGEGGAHGWPAGKLPFIGPGAPCTPPYSGFFSFCSACA